MILHPDATISKKRGVTCEKPLVRFSPPSIPGVAYNAILLFFIESKYPSLEASSCFEGINIVKSGCVFLY